MLAMGTPHIRYLIPLALFKTGNDSALAELNLSFLEIRDGLGNTTLKSTSGASLQEFFRHSRRSTYGL